MDVPPAIARGAALAAATTFSLLVGFQMVLALGVAWVRVDWGHAAWGDEEVVLSPPLRIASAAAALILIAAAFVVLGRAGYWGKPASPDSTDG